jgi:hypothetical protein
MNTPLFTKIKVKKVHMSSQINSGYCDSSNASRNYSVSISRPKHLHQS